jgi:AcrR family transcriptional regulator
VNVRPGDGEIQAVNRASSSILDVHLDPFMAPRATASSSRLRQHLRGVTSATILEAAEATFATRGVGATSMQDIAQRSGVAVGTLYNHFRDKEQLVTKLLANRNEHLIGKLDEAKKNQKGAPIREQTRAFVSAVLSDCEAHRGFIRMFLRADDPSIVAMKRKKGNMEVELLDRATRLVQSGVRRGEIDRAFAPLLPAMLVAMLRGVLQQSIAGEVATTPDLVDAVVTTFFDGAAARAPSRAKR